MAELSSELPNCHGYLSKTIKNLSLEDPSISVFERRNDIHIYISDELVFGHFNSHHIAGFRNSEHTIVTFRNLFTTNTFFNALSAGLLA